MPRKARIKDDYGIYHITQLSNNNTNLFINNDDREKFLEILAVAKAKNNFRLYAYCLAKDDTYHLVINSNGSDISKIMKAINISYAMYLNTTTPLFKDRFKSELIRDRAKLTEILDELHENGKKSKSKYNSYCFYDEDIIENIELVDKEDLDSISEDCKNTNSDCMDCIKTVEAGIDKLNNFAREKDLTIEELYKDKQLRNKLIRDIRKTSTLSLKEIGYIFGNISESSISKILSNKK